jgi:hypothetical protein
MISVTFDQLDHALRLARSGLREPTDRDGVRSWIRQVDLSYAGDGHLTFRATDHRIILVSKLRIDGDDAPWRAVVPRRWFEGLVGLEQVRVELSLAEGILTAQRDLLHYRTRVADPGAEFPAVVIAPGGEVSAPARIGLLRDALQFTSAGSEPEDPLDRRQICTAFRDGIAMGARRSVTLRAPAPPLPFELDLRRREADRIARWLGKLAEIIGDAAADVEVARVTDPGGRIYHRVRDPAGDHTLWVPAARESFLRAAVDQVGVPAALEARVDRPGLASLAGFVGARSVGRRLVSRFRRAEGRWNLDIGKTSERDGDRLGDAVLELSPLSPPNEAPLGDSFEVVAHSLWIALKRFDTERVVLLYRPGARTLSVRADAEATAEAPVRPEAFLRAERHRPASGPGAPALECATSPPGE